MNESPNPAPLVSVVMCAYNAGPFIESAVESILQQTYPNWELIISDDGSTDGTREWLRRLEGHPKVRLYFQEQNLGYVGNKNFAHQQARGEYITQLDNDDTCTPDRLQKQLAVVTADPSIKLVGCGYHRISMDDRIFDTRRLPEDRLITRPEVEYPFWFPSLLVHKSVFEAIGFFDPYFAGVLGDDQYWTVKANEQFSIYCLKEPLYNYRSTQNSITSVLNNSRKLIFTTVLKELLRQRRETGTDWLQQRDYARLEAYEQELMSDNKFIGGQYRAWAAMAIDKKDWKQANRLMRSAFLKYPLNAGWYRTAYYYLRKRLA